MSMNVDNLAALRAAQAEELAPHLDKPTTQGCLARLQVINNLIVNWITEELVGHHAPPHDITEALAQMTACNMAMLIRSVAATAERGGVGMISINGVEVSVRDALGSFAVRRFLDMLAYYAETDRFVEAGGKERMEEIRAKRRN